MLRTDRYKYIIYESGSPREQLIDLAQDPGEMKNLASNPASSDVLKRHRGLLKQWYRENDEKLEEKYVVP
jgi:arylsulfatase A-like enzyme